MFTRAGRGKIDVRITNLFSNSNREDSIAVPVTTGTTAAEVVQLVLEKCKRKEEPFCYQLWLMCHDKSSTQLSLVLLCTKQYACFFLDRVLADSECPQVLKGMWKSSGKQQNYFQLYGRKSGLVKVFYRAEGKSGTESFHSVIVSPSTSCQQLVKMVAEKLHISHQEYTLVEKRTSSGESKW